MIALAGPALAAIMIGATLIVWAAAIVAIAARSDRRR